MIQRRFQNQRKSIRLGNYDYSSAGAYFVTICSQSRANWFGTVTRDGMQLNDAGQMILKTWNELLNRFDIELDTFIIMPDHVHGIIILPTTQNNKPHQNPVGEGLVPSLHQPNAINPVLQGDTTNSALQGDTTNPALHRETTRVSPTDDGASLFDVVGAFKSLTTNQYSRGVREAGWESFEKRLWERSFHDSIIRDEVHFEKTKKYILENPHRWLESRGLL